jgi:uncharacterized protein (TIGR03067 family)
MSHSNAIVIVLSSCVVLTAARFIPAQAVIGPGSTVQGDVLRGEGAYLGGRGIYELYSAQGRRIDAGTEIMIQKWNMQVYDAYMRQRAAHMQFRKNLTKKQESEARQKMAEREKRLRTNPTDDDVVSGDALNALLVDLSDPMISPSSWRAAPVALPGAISIRSLFFRFAPRFGDKNAGALSSNLIALGRLDPVRGWPIFIPEDKLGAERRAYEAAHRNLLDQCEKDALQLDAVTRLDAALNALKAKVNTAVPIERKFRATADKYVADMQAATKIFDASTIGFAQEMIRDTHDYTPQTIGELLAFLRKYRLFFASAEGRPEDTDVYRALFALMREQKMKLGLPMLPPQLAPAPPPEEAKLQGTWVLIRTRKNGETKTASSDPALQGQMLIFDGNHYVARNPQQIWNKGTWKLDASKTPRVLDRVGVNSKKESVTFYGIYDWVENGNLRICSSRTRRPDDFKAPPNSDRVIQVWARTKP